MKYFDWDPAKNEWLKVERGVCFDDIVSILEAQSFLEIFPHPNKEKYKNQKIYSVLFRNYVYLVPFVEDEEKIFLKTIIPSRKKTKQYLKLKDKKL